METRPGGATHLVCIFNASAWHLLLARRQERTCGWKHPGTVKHAHGVVLHARPLPRAYLEDLLVRVPCDKLPEVTQARQLCDVVLRPHAPAGFVAHKQDTCSGKPRWEWSGAQGAARRPLAGDSFVLWPAVIPWLGGLQRSLCMSACTCAACHMIKDGYPTCRGSPSAPSASLGEPWRASLQKAPKPR